LIKKILIIPSWYPNKDNPGLGTFFREQAALFEADYNVRILAGHLNSKNSRIKKLFNSLAYVTFKKPSIQRKEDYFLTPPQVYGFSYRRGLNKFKKANFNLIIKSYLNYFELHILPNWKPDIIHAHDTLFGGIVANTIFKKWHIPYIITEHNYLLFDQPSYMVNDFIESMKNASHLLVVSDYQKRILRYRNIRQDVHVVGNYIDEKLYTLGEKKAADRVFKILFVGRFAHHKDYDTLVKTINLFSERIENDNYRFQIIGTGEEGKTFLEKHTHNSIYHDHCEVHPYISREDIPVYFKNCDVLLNTSIAETFGVVTGESMMCGKPVVSTNSGGFDEMHVPGVNGIKCPIGDAESLAKALIMIKHKEIVFDPVQIRESVLHKFGTQAFITKMKQFYE
jgi:glycosyltransferase involved in cell wall biosynthesis